MLPSFQLLPYVDKYHPLASIPHDADVMQLFSCVTVAPHNSINSNPQALWLNLPKSFNGKSVRLVPSKQLAELIKTRNIYGFPVDRDMYFQIIHNTSGYFLYFTFQHIIGGSCLLELSDTQIAQLRALYI